MAKNKKNQALEGMEEERMMPEVEGAETEPAADQEPKEDTVPESEVATDSQEMEALRAQNEALKKQMEEMQAQISALNRPTVVQVAAETERVHFLWQAEVAPENVQTFGEGGMYGKIVGKPGSFYVPKPDLSRVMDERNRYFLDKRWLIVVSGLDQEEREALGVDYKEGELLDKNAFARMVELGDELVELYGELCAGHKEMVARRYGEAFAQGSPYVTRDRVLRLSEMSKAAEMEPNPFQRIIEGMNERDAGK